MLFKNPEGVTRSSLLIFFFLLSVCCQSFFQAWRFSGSIWKARSPHHSLLDTTEDFATCQWSFQSSGGKRAQCINIFQISCNPIFAVLRKMEMMSKFLSYPFTPILYVLYGCLFSQVREQKLMLLTHFLVPAVQNKGCTWSKAISSHPFLLYVCNWAERSKDESGLHTSTLLPSPHRSCSSLAD